MVAGPVTLVFPVQDPARTPAVQRWGSQLVAELYHEGTLGVRCPDDVVAQAVLQKACGPVVAASANRAGNPPPRTADDRARARTALGDAQVLLKIPLEAPLAVYTGRLHPDKGLFYFVRAWRTVVEKHPTARLWLVGDGPERASWQAQRPDAIFCGTQTGDALAAHYASGDVFLFPSLTETWGNVTIEAMASGLAVLAYDCAAAEEVIRHGENGLKVTPEDEAAFTAEAAALAPDASLQRRLGEAAAARAAQLSWDAIIDRFEHVLLRLAHPQPTADTTMEWSSAARTG